MKHDSHAPGTSMTFLRPFLPASLARTAFDAKAAVMESSDVPLGQDKSLLIRHWRSDAWRCPDQEILKTRRPPICFTSTEGSFKCIPYGQREPNVLTPDAL